MAHHAWAHSTWTSEDSRNERRIHQPVEYFIQLIDNQNSIFICQVWNSILNSQKSHETVMTKIFEGYHQIWDQVFKRQPVLSMSTFFTFLFFLCFSPVLIFLTINSTTFISNLMHAKIKAQSHLNKNIRSWKGKYKGVDGRILIYTF